MIDLPRIPQTDPGAVYRANAAAYDAAVLRVLASGSYVKGSEVACFEKAFAARMRLARAVGAASGTDALALALRGLGIGPGDAVVTASHTAVATVAAIESTGAVPVLIDIEAEGYTMAPDALDAVLEDPPPGLPIRAVIPVHLYGQPADMARIMATARRHGVYVVEDCAQAHGASIDGRPVGGFGDAGAWSFYPTKNLGAFGDGGMVGTDDPALADRIAAIGQYGWDADRVSMCAGINSRLDEMQAAFLRVGLRGLDADNRRRRAIADAYDHRLAGLGLTLPKRRHGAAHVFHQYVIRSGGRDGVRRALAERGIGTAVHYPLPVHLHPAWCGRVAIGPTGLERTESVAREVLSLPMHPHMTDGDVSSVCAAIRQILR